MAFLDKLKEPSLEYGQLPSLPHPGPGCTDLFQRRNVQSSRSLSRINRSILISEFPDPGVNDSMFVRNVTPAALCIQGFNVLENLCKNTRMTLDRTKKYIPSELST